MEDDAYFIPSFIADVASALAEADRLVPRMGLHVFPSETVGSGGVPYLCLSWKETKPNGRGHKDDPHCCPLLNTNSLLAFYQKAHVA